MNLIICKICNEEFEELKFFSGHLRFFHKISKQEYYDTYCKKPFEGYCKNPYCLDENSNSPKKTKFVNPRYGYREYCSTYCLNHDPERIKKLKEDNPMHKEENIKKTSEKLKNIFNDEDRKQQLLKKRKDTIINRYGSTENYYSLMKEKQEKTNLEKYGYKHISESEEFINNMKNKYENMTQNDKEKINNKRKKTNLEKYGVEDYVTTAEFKAKNKKTVKEKYGVEHISQTTEFKKKCKETMLEKYGVEHISQTTEFKKKCKETMLEKYGVEHHLKLDENKLKQKATQLTNYRKKVEEKVKTKNLEVVDINELESNKSRLQFRCLTCGKIFDGFYNSIIFDRAKCPYCKIPQHRYSKVEKELLEYIECISPKNIEILANYKQLIKSKKNDNKYNKEVDIYIPELKIAIEFDGLYWHSDERQTNKNHHLYKNFRCQKQGVRLIQIFEDEWEKRKEIVKSKLSRIFNYLDNFIMINDYYIELVDNKTKDKFILENDYCLNNKNTNINIALIDKENNEIINILSIDKLENYNYEIEDFYYNINYHINDSESILLEFFKNNYEYDSILYELDIRWKSIEKFIDLNFKKIGFIQPDYYYVISRNRMNNKIKPKIKHKLIYDSGKILLSLQK